jgi:hypothetical protein
MQERDPEAERLAAQRTDDLSAITERELKRARALGKKDAEDEQFRDGTVKHFAEINGHINGFRSDLQVLAGEVHDIKDELASRDRVNVALVHAAETQGATRLTRFQKVGVVLMALFSLGSLLVAILEAIGHAG